LADPVQRRIVERPELAPQTRQPRTAAVQDVEEATQQDQDSRPMDPMLVERDRRTHRDHESDRGQQVRTYPMPGPPGREWLQDPVCAATQGLQLDHRSISQDGRMILDCAPASIPWPISSFTRASSRSKLA